MIKVNLSNGKVLNFPDSMSKEEIKTVIQMKFPVKNVASQPQDTFWGKLPLPKKEEPIPGINDEDTTNAMIEAAAFGPGINAVGKGFNYAAESIGGVNNISDVFKNLFKKVEPKKMIKNMQAKHDELQEATGKMYDYVKEEAKKRNADKLAVDKGLRKLIDDMHDYFPKSKANQRMIDNAKSGNYEALHDLQSDAAKRAEKLKSSSYTAENDQGELLLEKREELINRLKNHFKNTGNSDLSDKWQSAREAYKKIHDTYYPRSSNAIGKIFAKETREIPSNPIALLTKDSVPVNRLLDSHPEIKDLIKVYQNREASKKLLKALGLTGGAVFGYSQLKNIFSE